MSKHVIDRPDNPAPSQRAAHYTRQEADKMPRPQTKSLQKRQRSDQTGNRLKAYTKIDRQSDS